jgi:methylmalonyl-CoA mutase
MTKEVVEGKQPVGEEEQDRFFAEFPYPTYEEWRAESEKALKGANWEKTLLTKTYEDIQLQPMYRMEDIEGITHCDSAPGSYPFVRGTSPTGYLTKPWEICQECDEPLASAFHDVVLHELNKGGTAVNMVVDKASKLGIDVDKSDAAFVGKGLSVSTLEDIQQALSGINLEKTPLFLSAGPSSVQLSSLIIAFMKANGQDLHKFTGCIGADPLAYLSVEGELPATLTQLYDEMSAAVAWVAENGLNLKPILVQGQPYHDSGASAIQELAYVLATGVEYLRNLADRGIAIDTAAKQMYFSFSVGTNFFMEIAKIRAARMLWAQIVEAFGGSEDAQKMHIHARTSAFTKSVYDPYVNMLRTTTEAFSAVVGGVDSLHVGYFDEAIRPADTFSHRISRNNQIMLQRECNLLQPVDPAGGSWYVEKLTNTVAQKAWDLFQETEAAGGITKALEQNVPQQKIKAVAKNRADGLAKRKDVILGTNMYPNLIEKPLDVQPFDYQAFMQQRSKDLASYREDIDEVECLTQLSGLKDKSKTASHTGSAIVDAAIQSVLSGATLGELTAALRQGDSASLVIPPLDIHRADREYCQLRKNTESYVARTGKNLDIFLANMGKIPQHKARADFVTGFLEVGAFKILKNDGFPTVEEAAQAAIESGASVAVICSTDATYPELVPPLAKLIKEAKPDMTLFLAGLPPEDLQKVYKEAGVDDFIHVRANCYQMLSKLQKERGIQ